MSEYFFRIELFLRYSTKQSIYYQISYILPNNNMAGIAIKYVTENGLNNEMSIEELT